MNVYDDVDEKAKDKIIGIPSGCKSSLRNKKQILAHYNCLSRRLPGKEIILALASRYTDRVGPKEYIAVPDYKSLVHVLRHTKFPDKRNGGKHTPHLYEIIVNKHTTPVWFGIDVEKVLKAEYDGDDMRDSNVFKQQARFMLQSLLKWLTIFLKERFNLPQDWMIAEGQTCEISYSHKLDPLDSSYEQNCGKEGKMSYHVKLYISMPNHASTGAVLEQFVSWIKRKWRSLGENTTNIPNTEHTDKDMYKELQSLHFMKRQVGRTEIDASVVDLDIYGDFRLMRCLYSSKTRGDTRTLMPCNKSSKHPEDHLMVLHDEQKIKHAPHSLTFEEFCPDWQQRLESHAHTQENKTRVNTKGRVVTSTHSSSYGRNSMKFDCDRGGLGMCPDDINAITKFIENDPGINHMLSGPLHAAQVHVSNIIPGNTQGTIVFALTKNDTCKCPFAGRVHKSNNGYFVYNIAENLGTYRCLDTECCRKPVNKGPFAFEMSCLCGSQEVSLKDKLFGAMKRRMYKAVTENVAINALRDDLASLGIVDKLVDYNEPVMRPLCATDGIHAVEGGCGVGKSEAVKQFVASLDPSTRILVISATQSVCSKMHQDLACLGFQDYRETKHSGSRGHIDDVNWMMDSDRLVVCINSLVRLSARDASNRYDVVIVDEALSVNLALFQPSSMMNAPIVSGLYETLLACTPQVILIDANMSNLMMVLMVKWLKEFRAACTNMAPDVTWIRNTFVRKSNRKAHIINVPLHPPSGTQKSDVKPAEVAASEMCSLIISALADNKKVCLAVSSPDIGKFVANSVEAAVKDKKIGIYTSETEDARKKSDFANANEAFSQFDLLIYSPSMTAGVSFTLSHFDHLFAWFINSPGTPTADVCQQMLFRVRQLKEGQMTIYVVGSDGEHDGLSQLDPKLIADKLDKDLRDMNKICGGGAVPTTRDSLASALNYDKERVTWSLLVGYKYNKMLSHMCFGDLLVHELQHMYGIPVTVSNYLGEHNGSATDVSLSAWKQTHIEKVKQNKNNTIGEMDVAKGANWAVALREVGKMPFKERVTDKVLDELETRTIQEQYMNGHQVDEDLLLACHASLTARKVWRMNPGDPISETKYKECIQLHGKDAKKAMLDIQEKRRTVLRFKQAIGKEPEDIIKKLLADLDVGLDYVYDSVTCKDITIHNDKNIKVYKKQLVGYEQKLLLSQAVLNAMIPCFEDRAKLKNNQDVKIVEADFNSRFMDFIAQNGGNEMLWSIINTFDIDARNYKSNKDDRNILDHLTSAKILNMMRCVLSHGLGIDVLALRHPNKTCNFRLISSTNVYAIINA